MTGIEIPRFTNRDSFGIVESEIGMKNFAPCSSCETLQTVGYLSDSTEGPTALLGLRSVDEGAEDWPILCAFDFFGKYSSALLICSYFHGRLKLVLIATNRFGKRGI